ncbi:MAG: DUF177 domain-containing protein [Betaproteobacteria bacterium]|nr:DUF177 domain-containing protein [Betaproteobacteria bacterium]
MPTEIDAFELTRAGLSLEGCAAVGSLGRLSSLLASQDGELAWRIDGWRQRDAAGVEQMYLRLRASATVGLPCGRCLGVVHWPLAIDRGFLLAATEARAAELDDTEEELDVLVASRQFLVMELLEDEAILALPPASSHAQCERPESSKRLTRSGHKAASADESAPPSPFAALESLKRKPSS